MQCQFTCMINYAIEIFFYICWVCNTFVGVLWITGSCILTLKLGKSDCGSLKLWYKFWVWVKFIIFHWKKTVYLCSVANITNYHLQNNKTLKVFFCSFKRLEVWNWVVGRCIFPPKALWENSLFIFSSSLWLQHFLVNGYVFPFLLLTLLQVTALGPAHIM